jgi:hypothetical protein
MVELATRSAGGAHGHGQSHVAAIALTTAASLNVGKTSAVVAGVPSHSRSSKGVSSSITSRIASHRLMSYIPTLGYTEKPVAPFAKSCKKMVFFGVFPMLVPSLSW